MGSWGTESCSNDSCWDHLHAKDIHNMSQKEANNTMDILWKDGITDNMGSPEASLLYYNELKLGVIVWILSQARMAPIDRLDECLIFATESLEPEKLEKTGWRDLQERANSLRKEVLLIESAIENGGRGEQTHIKGLFERMGDTIDQETIAQEKAMSGERTIELPCYGIIVNLTGDGGGAITSDMSETCPYCEDPACDMYCENFDDTTKTRLERVDFLRHRAAIDAIESIVMAHAVAGIDITTPAYIEGIETVQQALTNTDYSVEEL